MDKKKCLSCGKKLENLSAKYCNQSCQNKYQRDQKVNLWLEGKHNGMRGKTSTARFIKHHLIETRGEKCEKCEWCQVNERTGKVPIELNHIDGNFMNNSIVNLELLCPNCHSLTPTYKSLNNGGGRPR